MWMWFWEHWQPFMGAVVSIFAIINPVGNLPILAGLTEGAATHERRRVFRLAGGVSLGILCGMTVLGNFLMHIVFHISLDEFSFAGGLLLVAVGVFNMLQGIHRHDRKSFTGAPNSPERLDEEITLAVTPIAFPLLVGPGSIVTVLLIANSNNVLYALAASVGAFVFVMLVLNWSHQLLRWMGRVLVLAIGRVMQIFIIAIGIHFMFNALGRIFPGLMH